MDIEQLESILDMPSNDQLKKLGLDEQAVDDLLLHQFEAYVTRFIRTMLAVDPSVRLKIPGALSNIQRRLMTIKPEPKGSIPRGGSD